VHSPASASRLNTTYALEIATEIVADTDYCVQVLLVPTTEVLLTSRDKETNTLYADLSGSEDFLASHVLRVPGGVGPNNHVKDAGSFRETRGKAKQFTTANGRTVIVKDAFIYSNKGVQTCAAFTWDERAYKIQVSRH
jgi:hypothetical protein